MNKIGRHGYFDYENFYHKRAVFLTDSIEYLGYSSPRNKDIFLKFKLKFLEITESRAIGAHCAVGGELDIEYRKFVEDPTSKG